MNIYESIEQDIALIEPNASTRTRMSREHHRKHMQRYSKKYYAAHKQQLRQQARERYKPVIQSSYEHSPIDYDEL